MLRTAGELWRSSAKCRMKITSPELGKQLLGVLVELLTLT